MIDLRELQKNSWQISEDHGFHEAMLNLPPKTLATYLKVLLTAGELFEAAEELRAGHEPDFIYFRDSDNKPEGFPIELADALIRLCDLAEDVGVDLEEATSLKAAYNKTREFMHGKTA